MKKLLFTSILLIFIFSNALAQQEKGITGFDNWLNPWTDFTPNKTDYRKPNQIISGDITKDTKLLKRNTYILMGDVFVTDSTTLSIEPGTVIIGDFKTKATLTITNGSKIMAVGESTDPIVFTSSQSLKKPGDWGGIFILGDAPTTKEGVSERLNYGLSSSNSKNIAYGGDNPESNSGVMEYVRIEYAGKRTKEYGYFNGLTLAGVGSETILNNIMVSLCRGNSFSVKGGQVELEKFVSYKSSANDFKVSNGAQCRLMNSLAVKSPYISGAQASRCIYALNNDDDEAFAEINTTLTAENLTLINVSKDLSYDIQVGLVNEAIFIGRDANFSIDKSVISGFKPAVYLDSKIRVNSESLDKIQFTSTYFNNCEGNIFVKNTTVNEDLENWYGSRAFNNVYSKGPDSETFIDAQSTDRPDYRLIINKIAASKTDN